MAAEQQWPQDWMPAFLAALRNSANVRASCQAVNITRANAYKARASSARFRTAWDDALADAVDVLEAVAWDRARKQSDWLLWKLLQAHRRDFYGDRVKQEHTGKDGAPLTFTIAIDRKEDQDAGGNG